MELETRDSSAFAVAPHALPTSDPASDLNPEDPRGLDQQLEPADGGAAAWKVLFAAFMFEALLWGKLLSYLAMDVTLNAQFSRLPNFIRCISRLLF